ncbi:MAG TPA: class IV adenylate cyclase [Tissierellaceae bacterium]|nr:class IV adenylate cyclase [Tissierellaceae bacterium]
MERELEVKILGIDLEEMEKRVISLGGVLIAKEIQTNTLIDSSESPIKTKVDAYLRIRETKDLLNNKSDTVITLKKNLSKDGIRDNIELTTEIADKEIMLEILNDLGFDDTEVGYKERKSYELMDARLDFDKWDKNTYPFPYVEIEVRDMNHLNEITKALEIPQGNISTKSIVQLRKELKLV